MQQVVKLMSPMTTARSERELIPISQEMFWIKSQPSSREVEHAGQVASESIVSCIVDCFVSDTCVK